MKRQLNVHISEWEMSQLTAIAQREEDTKTNIVRRALREFANRYEQTHRAPEPGAGSIAAGSAASALDNGARVRTNTGSH